MKPALAIFAVVLLCGTSARAERAPIEKRAADIVGSAPVILLGENHNDPPSHRLLQDFLPALKTLNVSVLAVELPSDWQDKATAYLAGRRSPLAALESRLAARFEKDGQSAAGLHSWFALIRAAADAGLAVHFVDLDSAAKEAGYARSERDASTLAAFDDAREKSMAGRTAELARRASPGKAALLIGAQHARATGIPSLLRLEGLSSRSIRVMPYEPVEGALELLTGSVDGLDYTLRRISL